jgi:hypothetical protein
MHDGPMVHPTKRHIDVMSVIFLEKHLQVYVLTRSKNSRTSPSK